MIRKRPQIESDAKTNEAFCQLKRDCRACVLAPNARRLGLRPPFSHHLRDAEAIGKINDVAQFNRSEERLIIPDRGAGGVYPPSPERRQQQCGRPPEEARNGMQPGKISADVTGRRWRDATMRS